MCGRYSLSTPADFVAEVFGVEEALELGARYNIAPTQEAPIVRASDDRREFRMARWGLVPSWARDGSIGQRTINARSETAAETRSFRDSFRSRRCLVPADGFYEWQKRPGGGKQTFHLTLADGTPFAFAGLYDLWRQAEDRWLESFTILTTEPNPLVAPIHDRMPVILPADAYGTWLDPSIEEAELLRPVLRPYPAESMLATPVGAFVNSPLNEGPACVEPVEPADEPRNLTLWD